MNATRWESVKAVFLHATSLPEESREAYLDSLGAGSDEIARVVRELLTETVEEGVLEIRRPCWEKPVDVDPRQSARPALPAGTLLARRFEVVMTLGAGGAGEVYRAFDRGQRDFVAVKVLHLDAVPDRAAENSLRNEVHTARMVTHPNICRLYEFYPGEPGQPPFITMELLLGRTLQQRLATDGIYSPDAAVPLIRQMLAGLESAHERGVVHRDFKPGNVMLVDGDSRPVLMDFGLARDLSPGRNLSETITGARLAGTIAYMAPEQLLGQPAAAAADIHAFGVVLFEMLTGQRPFDGGNPLETAARRLNEEAPRPLAAGRRLGRTWERVIASCLERDPARRPQSAAAVRKLLDSPVPVLWERRQWALGAGGAAVAAVAAMGLSSWTARPSRAKANDDAALSQYLRGSKLLEEFSPASARAALVAFDEALRIKPDHALSMAGRADASLYLSRVDARNRLSHLANARSAATEAVRMDPELAGAHTSLAAVLQADWKWKESEASYREALRLRPEMAKAHRWYGGLLLQFGRMAEAMDHARLAVELDPHDRALPATIGIYHFIAGQNQKALELLEPAVRELDNVGKSDGTRFNLAQVYAWTASRSKGQLAREYFDKAIRQAEIVRAFEKTRGEQGPSLADQLFSLIYVLRGDRKTAEPFLERVREDYAQRRIWVLPAAWNYALTGESERAIELLEQARREHDAGLLYVKVMPLLESLHGNPRFEALIQAMGLKN